MDTTKPVTHVSLCAGYGGIDLGLKRAIPNLRTIAFSEIEAFACANLVAKMEAGRLDAAPIWTDVKTFPWQEFRGKVDILSGGYPCQPFSAAGKRLGKDDPRHLWPWIADGIRICRPAVCFFENVEGHISLGLREVIEELESLGYRTTWGLFSAAEVGAPHQRKRIFILAHRLCERGQLSNQWRFAAEQMPVSNGATGRNELALAIQQGPAVQANPSTNGSRRGWSEINPQFWGTPRASERGDCPSEKLRDNPDLRAQVVIAQSWATPRSGKTTDENPKTWAKRKAQGQVATMPLTTQVKQEQWPTPASSTGHGGAHGLDGGTGARSMLPQEMKNSSGKLNPRWVETLMGLPVGWTMPSCTSPLTIAPTNCGSSAMESCLQPQNELFAL
jgi:DNA-cytosine methyltransferase